MEATAVSVGKAVLDGALGYAKSKAAEEIALQLGVERDVTFITDELQMMQSFLMTADEEKGENKVLTTWVKQVRDLAYNVEDNLMDFGIHSGKKPFWGCIPRDLCDRRRIAKEVKDLRAKVEDVSNRNLRYRLIKDGSSSKHAAAAEQASVASAAMFGINEARLSAVEREKSKVNLRQLINNGDEDLRVIAVWGSNGDVGKLSAIREVYDDPSVNLNFGFHAWVRLMRPFNPKEFVHSLVRQIYEKFPKKLREEQERRTVGTNVLMKVDNMGQSDIVDVFDAQVSDNSYLIVINDLSTIEEWDCIKQYFPDNKKGSRIIISTQQVEIASLCTEQPYQVSELKQLSSDQTLYLFHHKLQNQKEQANIAGRSMFGTNEAKLAAPEQEKLKMDLCQLISEEKEDLRVFAVQEAGSDLGMLSVIREVYDDPMVHVNFGFHAWVRLIHPFNPKEFLQNLLRQRCKNSLDEHEKGEGSVDSDVLKMEFDAQVSDKSYLIVINDLSTIEEWNCIKNYFPDNKNRSRIIISMQQVEIASLSTEKPYQVSEINQLTSGETLHLTPKVMPASGSKHISYSKEVTTIGNDRATASSEIQEEGQQSMDAGGNNLSTSTARNKFDRTRTMALVDEVVIGRKTEKSKVIELIGQPEDRQGCKVISVWGMGGLGKTTLVRSVYRSQQLGGWKRAWVTALRPFNPEVLFRSLALQLLKDVQEDPTEASGTKQEKKQIAIMGMNDLTGKLTELLEKQNCLIVVDDLSSTEEWNHIKYQLAKAKRIVVTTRENNVAKYCSVEDRNMYRLQALEHDEALGLFKSKVFKQSTEKNDLLPDMLDQAKLILKKCDGLPLAISTIGGFLATKPKTAIEWRKMNDRISAELEINPELRSIKTVLMRSYDGLPYHLKSSFLYMSIFPEDYRIRRKRLIRRWIAEGYSREIHGMEAEEVSDKYFDELLDRSMILPGEGLSHYSGKIDSCQLHDIIREICIQKAREENLVFTLEEGCCLSSTQGAIRHLVISSNWNRDKDVLESMLDLSHIRSLTVFGNWRPFFISDKMRFLRVLDLADTLGLRDHHLDQIGQLLHLVYLSIRGCTNIFCLPNSLGNLVHLQTLDCRGTWIARFPKSITKLRKLQHLMASVDSGGRQEGEDDSIFDELEKGESYFSLRSCSASLLGYVSRNLPDVEDHLTDGPKESYEQGEQPPATGVSSSRDCPHVGSALDVVRSCYSATSIRKKHCCKSLLFHSRMCLSQILFWLSMGIFFWRPQALADGLNRHDIFAIQSAFFLIVFEGAEAPRGIAKLKTLHTLGVVNVARGKTTLKELGELTQLRKLGVVGIYSRYSKKFWSAISGHSQLRSLSAKGYELDACLGRDLLPPKHLESLKLKGKLVKVTEWIHQLQNLSKLQLEETKLEQDAIQALGMLPNLAALRLRWKSFVGEKLHFQGSSFASLMVLELDRLFNLKSVLIEEQVMPKLELLQVNKYSAEEISGLAFLKSLKEIQLSDENTDKLMEGVQRQVAKDLKHVSLKLM